MKRMAVGTAGIALAIAVALGAAVPAAQAVPASAVQAQGVGWRVSWTGPRNGAVSGITAPARNAAWAYGSVGSRQFLARWNGRKWRESVFPARGYSATSIASSSADDVWLFGFLTKTLKAEELWWDGTKWLTVPGPAIANQAQYGDAVLGQDDVWIAVAGAAYNWNGQAWSKVSVPAGFRFGQLGGSPSGGIWIASRGRLSVYRWSETGWLRVRSARPSTRSTGLDVVSAKSVWVVTQASVLHWNGTRWSEQANGDAPVTGPLAAFGKDGLWITAYELWTGSAWVVTLPYDNLGYLVFSNGLTYIPGTGQTWLAGDSHHGAVIMESTG
jgi:hypothetical protein